MISSLLLLNQKERLCAVKGTIKSTDEISAFFKTAQKITTNNLMVLVKKRDDKRGSQGRVAFVAGKRLGNAPQRNKAKRLMRHAAFLAGVPWPDVDVVFIAREKPPTMTLGGLAIDMETVKHRWYGQKKAVSR
jgi:ribonuclease P protein component